VPHFSGHPLYTTTLPHGLLVAMRATGSRATGTRFITKTFRAEAGQSPADLRAQAVHWRDRAWRRLFGGSVPGRSFHETARSGSTTGIPGIRLINKAVKSKKRPHTID
jgi:hypothetical protein